MAGATRSLSAAGSHTGRTPRREPAMTGQHKKHVASGCREHQEVLMNKFESEPLTVDDLDEKAEDARVAELWMLEHGLGKPLTLEQVDHARRMIGEADA